MKTENAYLIQYFKYKLERGGAQSLVWKIGGTDKKKSHILAQKAVRESMKKMGKQKGREGDTDNPTISIKLMEGL